MTSPTYLPCPDAAALRAAIAPWLSADPTPYALLCGVAGQIADDGWCGVIAVADEPVLALVQTPPRPVLVASPRPTNTAVAGLARELFCSPGRMVRGVNGPTGWAEAIVAAQPAKTVDRQGIRLHRLVGPPRAPSQPAGTARPFHHTEGPLLQAWLGGFDKEIGEPQHGRSLFEIEAIRGDCLAWTVDDHPVSMAKRARPLLGGWTITAVYTPSELRGRGYAGAVVHALSTQLLAEGSSYVALYTDLANPISNRLYARIGFVPLLDQTRITWESP